MNILNNLGISISYNRVLELKNLLATAVCKQFGVWYVLLNYGKDFCGRSIG